MQTIDLLDAYKNQFGAAGAVLAIFAALAIGMVCGVAATPVKQKLSLPIHEAAAVAGLMAVPSPAFALAATVTHRLVAHCMIILVLGAAMLFVFGAHRDCRWLSLPGHPRRHPRCPLASKAAFATSSFPS